MYARHNAVVLCTIVLIIASRVSAGEPNTLSKEEKDAGWTLLVDGETTEGWRNFRQEKINNGWKVVDGAITRAGDGAGDIVTDKEYEAFELSLEYKISKGGNSGLMYHVTETEDTP